MESFIYHRHAHFKEFLSVARVRNDKNGEDHSTGSDESPRGLSQITRLATSDNNPVSVERNEDNRNLVERDEIELKPKVPTADEPRQRNDRPEDKDHRR